MRRWLALAVIALVSCGPDGSVIYDTDPFFRIEADFSQAERDGFVQTSAQFAKRRGYQIAVNDFGDGKFDLLIYDAAPASLNIAAGNSVTHGEITIDAMSRGLPTQEHRAAVISYVAAVRPHLRNPRHEELVGVYKVYIASA